MKYQLVDFYENPDGEYIDGGIDENGEYYGGFETLYELEDAIEQYVEDTDGECDLVAYRWNSALCSYTEFEI